MSILRGVARFSGDGWKDTTRKGDVVFVYGEPLPRPYIGHLGELQYEIVGNICQTACDDQFAFKPASLLQRITLLPSIWRDRRDRKMWAFRREVKGGSNAPL